MMTTQEALEIINDERKCLSTDCDRDCARCQFQLVRDEEDIIEAFDIAIKALSPSKPILEQTSFKKGDKFILEIGDRQLDEFEIAGTNYYIKIYLLKMLTPYKPEEEEHEKNETINSTNASE